MRNLKNDIIIKNHEIFGEVRFLIINDKEYAVANDILKALGYAEGGWRTTLSRKCKHVTKCNTPTNSGEQEVNFIPEGDIYRLIVGSHLPEAEKFESWVFDEVLPSIRKNGYYISKEYEKVIEKQNNQIKELKGITETKDKEILELKELNNKKSEQIEQLVLCVGLRDRQTKMYTNYIKNRIGIERTNSDYYKIRKALFKKFGVEKWEDLAISDKDDILSYIDRLIDAVDTCHQLCMF